MDDRTSHPASQTVIESVDASARDLVEGNVRDAESVQAEAHRILADQTRGDLAS
jgi:hypothetical protein